MSCARLPCRGAEHDANFRHDTSLFQDTEVFASINRILGSTEHHQRLRERIGASVKRVYVSISLQSNVCLGLGARCYLRNFMIWKVRSHTLNCPDLGWHNRGAKS